LDTPHGDLIKILSSSYNLLLFSSKAGSGHSVGAGAASRELSSMSVGDLWPEITSSRGVADESAFATAPRGHLETSMSRPLSGARGSKERRIKENSKDGVGGIALEQALGPSSAPKKGCGGS
jgi:hypothetical protein